MRAESKKGRKGRSEEKRKRGGWKRGREGERGRERGGTKVGGMREERRKTSKTESKSGLDQGKLQGHSGAAGPKVKHGGLNLQEGQRALGDHRLSPLKIPPV